MSAQLDLQAIPKKKKMPSNIHELWSGELHYKKKWKK
jgi:hypothetical protein